MAAINEDSSADYVDNSVESVENSQQSGNVIDVEPSTGEVVEKQEAQQADPMEDFFGE